MRKPHYSMCLYHVVHKHVLTAAVMNMDCLLFIIVLVAVLCIYSLNTWCFVYFVSFSDFEYSDCLSWVQCGSDGSGPGTACYWTFPSGFINFFLILSHLNLFKYNFEELYLGISFFCYLVLPFATFTVTNIVLFYFSTFI